MIRSVEEAGAWLTGLINLERRPDWPYARLGLGPIRRLLERLGNPERELAVIHVAGSKGKGSTALLAEAVLEAAGRRVGTYTSPHLERWTERVRVAGREVEGAALAAAVEAVRPHVEALRAAEPADAPTFFDATTAAALLCFRDAGVDHAILEVGLGGRLDSTNAVQPRVACVTSIELEHTDKLGNTLAAIAAEKAGILKRGAAVVIGSLPRAAREVVLERARALEIRPARAGREFDAEVRDETSEGLRLGLRDGPLRFEATLPVLGRHQAANAALALACVRRAADLPDAALAEAAARGWAGVVLPGRVERLRRDPLVLIDSAHTGASARALAAALAGIPRRRTHLVLSVSAGKQLDAVLAALLPLAEQLTVTRADAGRSLAETEIARAARARGSSLPLRVVPNPHLALRAAADALEPGDCLCVAGSVYLAGIARRLLRELPPAAGIAVTRRPPGLPVAGR